MTADAKARRLIADGTFDTVPSLLTTMLGSEIASTTDLVLVYDASADEYKSMTMVQLMSGVKAVEAANRLVTITATGAITAALHESKTCLLAEVGGDAAVTLTLPAATGSGGKYRFVVNVVNTSGYVIKAVAGADVFRGHVHGDDGGGVTTAMVWATGATDDTFTLNGTTTGGVARGDWVEFEDIATDGWAVRGSITQSGIEATPFSDTVA